MLYWWPAAVICFVTSVIFNFCWDYLRLAWLVLRMPGPFAWPLIGNAHWIADSKKLEKAAVECPKKYGSVIRAWLSVFPIVFLIDPQNIQKVLSNPKHIEKTSLYKMAHTFLGRGLITCGGTQWRRHRKLMQPYFHHSFIEKYLPTFIKGGELLSEKIANILKGYKDCAMNINPPINEVVFSVLTETILGVPMGSDLAREYEIESPYRKGSSALLTRLLRPWLLLQAVFNYTEAARNESSQKLVLFEFTRKAIEARKAMTDIKEPCYLDYLIMINEENPTKFSMAECVDEACTLMLAGQDSVGTALAFTLHLLANNEEHQKKVIDEQNIIFGGTNRPLTMDDIKKMTYLDQCLKEALRIYPSVPVIARTLGEDLPLEKYTLPKGCNIYISPYATHRLSGIYPDQERFDPDRFSAVASAKRPPYSYLPFSSGPRNCIGYKLAEIEMKTILSIFLRRYHLQPVIGKENPKISYRITLRASGGLWVSVRPRENLPYNPFFEK